MLQQILVVTLFIGSLIYVGRLVFQSFQAKSGCASGCGKCGALDVSKIEARLKKEGF